MCILQHIFGIFVIVLIYKVHLHTYTHVNIDNTKRKTLQHKTLLKYYNPKEKLHRHTILVLLMLINWYIFAARFNKCLLVFPFNKKYVSECVFSTKMRVNILFNIFFLMFLLTSYNTFILLIDNTKHIYCLFICTKQNYFST